MNPKPDPDTTTLIRELRSALAIALQQLDTRKARSGVHASSLHADLNIVRDAIASADKILKP